MNRRRFITSIVTGALAAPHMTTPAAAFTTTSHPRLLLLGASTAPGGTFLRHALAPFADLYAGARQVLLIVDAAAPSDRDRQARRADAIIRESCGAATTALHKLDDDAARAALGEADGVFVGGGQTFLLLRMLYDRGLLEPLRGRVAAGLPYSGSSAGSNIAGPVIGTTNDFPVTDIPSRRSLGVFPALINPHHPPADHPDHAGRMGKILDYLVINPGEVVLGLGEAAMVQTTGESAKVIAGPAWIYRDGKAEPAAEGVEIGPRLRPNATP